MRSSFFAILGCVLALPGPAAASDAPGFVVSEMEAVAVRNGEFRIAIGERYSASFIKARFRPFEVSFSDECEIECFVVSDGRSRLEIFGDEKAGKVTALIAWGEGTRDPLGNQVGASLREALRGGRGVCEYTEALICNSSIPGLRYFVAADEDCSWGPVQWHMLNEGDEVDVPACARLGGIYAVEKTPRPGVAH